MAASAENVRRLRDLLVELCEPCHPKLEQLVRLERRIALQSDWVSQPRSGAKSRLEPLRKVGICSKKAAVADAKFGSVVEKWVYPSGKC